MRHFLSLADHGRDDLLGLIARAERLKAECKRGERRPTLERRTLAMIFEKASTRTRVSFEVAMHHLGGHAIVLTPQGSQIGRGEPVEDTARVLSGYVDCIMIRTFAQKTVEDLARHATVPVINGLTDALHPCQVIADLLTVKERLGRLEDLVVAWIGDGNNMAHSWLNAARVLGLEIRLACPEGYKPDARYVDGVAGATVLDDPREAARGAHVIVTDVWASMGQEEEAGRRQAAFAGYTVDGTTTALADPGHIVLHCLPAHRGEEITAEVMEGPSSAIFQAAENRLHAQKALLEWLLLD
jgi:ornithine carbamoyltransferase